MNAPDTTVTGLCFRCGGPVTADLASCRYCGMPVVAPRRAPSDASSTAGASSVAGAAPGVLPPAGPTAAPSVADRPYFAVPGPPGAVPGPSGPTVAGQPPLAAPREPGPITTAGPPAAWPPAVAQGGGRPTLTVGPPPRPGLGRRGLLAVALIVLVLVGGGTAALTARLRRPDAAGTVRNYFAALVAGDGRRALSYVRTPAQFSLANFPLLGNAALADARHRPSGVHIGPAAPIAGARAGLDGSAVTVSYRVGGQRITQPVVVLHDAGSYLLQAPFVEVTVQNAAGRKITVNGVALAGRQLDTVAFPGSFDVAAAGNALFAAGSVSGPPRPGAQVPVAALDLGPPALASGALATIQRQARGELDACAASGQPATAGCPFGLNVPGTGPRVKWSITNYPTLTAAVAPTLLGDVGVAVTDDHTGKVHWDVTYTGLDGTPRHETGDSDFTVNGSASLTGSGIQVSLVG